MRNIYIRTFGCQMNIHDSEIIAGVFEKDGHKMVLSIDDADVVILNTCAVRDHAEKKVYSMIGVLRKKKEDPNCRLSMIAICGCVAQDRGREIIKKYPYVDMVVGTKDIDKLVKMVSQCHGDTVSRVYTDGENYFEPGADFIKRDCSYRAWVSIIKGCENYCAYCVVPYARGKEISRSKAEILDEIKRLGESGVREICLLGQNVNSYKGDSLCKAYGFVDLLNDIDKLNAVPRIKFVTSHPKDISVELLYAMRDLKSVCEFLHFPAQSGSNRILKLMNRGYTREHYIELVNKAREVVPNITIGTDFIVGFPGETEEDFQETVSLMQELKFDIGYFFKYSKRKGTNAYSFDNHLDEDVKKARHKILLDLQLEHTFFSNQKDVGKVMEVLVDGVSKTNSTKGQGRSRTNKVVIIENGSDLKSGEFVDVKIVRGTSYVEGVLA